MDCPLWSGYTRIESHARSIQGQRSCYPSRTRPGSGTRAIGLRRAAQKLSTVALVLCTNCGFYNLALARSCRIWSHTTLDVGTPARLGIRGLSLAWVNQSLKMHLCCPFLGLLGSTWPTFCGIVVMAPSVAGGGLDFTMWVYKTGSLGIELMNLHGSPSLQSILSFLRLPLLSYFQVSLRHGRKTLRPSGLHP